MRTCSVAGLEIGLLEATVQGNRITSASEYLTRSATVTAITATLVSPTSTNFTFSKADRGRIVAADVRRLTSLPDGNPSARKG